MSEHHVTELSEIPARVMACLMEKQLATPDQYPLTQNSLMLACNQKTNRNPVMNLTSGEVAHALTELEGNGWVQADLGSRSTKYEQRARKQLNLELGEEGKAEQAIICMLMLRGPQTLSEIVARTERMVHNEALVADRLDHLMNRHTPLVELLPRQSGQREDRYGQLVFDAGELTPLQSAPSRVSASADSARIDQLEQEVAELKQRLSDLEQRLNG